MANSSNDNGKSNSNNIYAGSDSSKEKEKVCKNNSLTISFIKLQKMPVKIKQIME